jgi:hypothetical protein
VESVENIIRMILTEQSLNLHCSEDTGKRSGLPCGEGSWEIFWMCGQNSLHIMIEKGL